MERTLEVIEEELRLAKEERRPLYEAVDILNKKIAKLNDEVMRYKLDNGLYHPMSELTNYIGKNISSITLVERDEEGVLDTDSLFNDEIFEVDEYGHLYYSSYSYGIIRYDDDAHKYVHMYYGYPEYCDYVGFLEINISEY